jgi:glycosyltransferase involved in cell wall biosynthesis
MTTEPRDQPDLSIVIITWRMRGMLRDLLVSLYEHTTGIAFEVILADNDSRDGTVEMLRAEFPAVRLIENDRNRGVAAARNQCFALARGRYRVTIDADMVLQENALGRLVAFMDDHPAAGLAGFSCGLGIKNRIAAVIVLLPPS